MNFLDFYNSIDNPFTDEALDVILDNYKFGLLLTSLYSIVDNTSGKLMDPKFREPINNKEKEKFYLKIYNRWRKGITDYGKSNLSSQQRESYNSFINYINSFGDIKNYEDIKKVWDYTYTRDKKYDEMQEYFGLANFAPENSGDSWVHINSFFLDGRQKSQNSIMHRFYVNALPKDVYSFLNILIDKYEKYDIPFYFKYEEHRVGDDPIVVYIDNNQLENNYKIFKEIKDEHPDLINSLYNPPMLMGVVDGWYGYGSEPQINGKSYTSIRAEIIEDVLSNVVDDWFSIHKDDNIMTEVGEMSVYNYALHKATMNKIRWINEDYMKGSKLDCVGYRDDDWADKGRHLYEVYYNQIKKVFDEDPKGKKKFPEFRDNDGRELYMSFFNGFDSIRVKQAIFEIAKKDDKFRSDIKEKILKALNEKGIATHKFCFDKQNYEEMLNFNKSSGDTIKANEKEAKKTKDIDTDVSNKTYETTNNHVDDDNRTKFEISVNPKALKKLVDLKCKDGKSYSFECVVDGFKVQVNISKSGYSSEQAKPKVEYGSTRKALELVEDIAILNNTYNTVDSSESVRKEYLKRKLEHDYEELDKHMVKLTKDERRAVDLYREQEMKRVRDLNNMFDNDTKENVKNVK